jgi:hypothetical protein
MRHLLVAAVVVVCAGLGTPARADDKGDVTGTWKWTVEFGGQSREMTLKLKKEDGDKISGAMIGRNNQETKIDEGKIKDGEISFKVTRQGRQGNKITTKYTGKISGDTIKGKSEMEINGEMQSRDWEAKKSKD